MSHLGRSFRFDCWNDAHRRASFYVHRIPYNYIKAVDFVPYFRNEVDGRKKSEDYKPFRTRRPELYGEIVKPRRRDA